MTERKGIITIHNNPLTLVGNPLKEGDKAPNFTLTDNDMNAVSMSAFNGKTLILSAVPSLDTPTCDMETRRFNQEAANLADDIKIVTVSADLPFAQKRWCAGAGIDKVMTLSSYKSPKFGEDYGIFIKELSLLARCIFVISKNGIIEKIHLVKEVSEEPNYDEVLNAVKQTAERR